MRHLSWDVRILSYGFEFGSRAELSDLEVKKKRNIARGQKESIPGL